MAVIAELAVNVVARTRDFVKGMTKAKKETHSFKRRLVELRKESNKLDMKGLAKDLKMVGAAAGAAMGYGVVQTIRLTMELNRNAIALNTNIDNLALIHHAYASVGAETDAYFQSLWTLNEQTKEYNSQTGELYGTLKDLGRLDIAEGLAGKDVIEQMRILLDRLREMEDVQGRMLIMRKAFGETEAIDVANLLNSQHLEEAFQLIRRGAGTGMAEQTKAMMELTATYQDMLVEFRKFVASETVKNFIHNLTWLMQQIAGGGAPVGEMPEVPGFFELRRWTGEYQRERMAAKGIQVHGHANPFIAAATSSPGYFNIATATRITAPVTASASKTAAGGQVAALMSQKWQFAQEQTNSKTPPRRDLN